MNRRFFDSTIYLKKRLMKYSNKKKRVLEVYDCQNERFFEKRKIPPRRQKKSYVRKLNPLNRLF